MSLDFTQADYNKMVALQRKISDVLLAFNRQEETEAMLAAFALVRAARELLNKYPERTRAMTVDQVLVPFLRNESVGGGEGRIITLQ